MLFAFGGGKIRRSWQDVHLSGDGGADIMEHGERGGAGNADCRNPSLLAMTGGKSAVTGKRGEKTGFLSNSRPNMGIMLDEWRQKRYDAIDNV